MIIDCAHYRGGVRQHEGPMELDRAAEICTDGDDGFIWMGTRICGERAGSNPVKPAAETPTIVIG